MLCVGVDVVGVSVGVCVGVGVVVGVGFFGIAVTLIERLFTKKYEMLTMY